MTLPDTGSLRVMIAGLGFVIVVLTAAINLLAISAVLPGDSLAGTGLCDLVMVVVVDGLMAWGLWSFVRAERADRSAPEGS